jgi:hypothetical protein
MWLGEEGGMVEGGGVHRLGRGRAGEGGRGGEGRGGGGGEAAEAQKRTRVAGTSPENYVNSCEIYVNLCEFM